MRDWRKNHCGSQVPPQLQGVPELVQVPGQAGSLHVGMRVERGSALLAALYANSHSKETYKLYDFMPHEEEPVISLDQALETWA